VVDKGNQFEFYVTTYEKELTVSCKIQFKDLQKKPMSDETKVSSPAV
jgi:hypothetical protein